MIKLFRAKIKNFRVRTRSRPLLLGAEAAFFACSRTAPGPRTFRAGAAQKSGDSTTLM